MAQEGALVVSDVLYVLRQANMAAVQAPAAAKSVARRRARDPARDGEHLLHAHVPLGVAAHAVGLSAAAAGD